MYLMISILRLMHYSKSPPPSRSFDYIVFPAATADNFRDPAHYRDGAPRLRFTSHDFISEMVKPSTQTLFSVLIFSFRQLKEFYNAPVLWRSYPL